MSQEHTVQHAVLEVSWIASRGVLATASPRCPLGEYVTYCLFDGHAKAVLSSVY